VPRSPYGLPAGELLPGERVLWSGRPAPAGFQARNAGQPAFLVIWLALASVAATHLGSLPLPIRVVADITWGAGMLSALGYLGYFIAARERFRRRDAYAITTWRVVAAPGLPGQRPRSAWLDQVASVSEQDGHGGVASLAISGPVSALRWPRRRQGPFSWASQPEFPQLHDLADAAVARDVLARARAAMRAGEAHFESPPPGPVAVLPPAVVLAPGERLLWTGRPARVPAWFGWDDAWISGFGLLVAVMFSVIAAVPGALAGPNVAFFAVFIACGAYLALGRVLYRWLRIRRSTYVLTSRRLIAAWGRTVAASDLRGLLPAQASGRSVICRPATPVATRGWDGWRLILAWPATTVAPPLLTGLADPSAVRDLVRQAQLAARLR